MPLGRTDRDPSTSALDLLTAALAAVLAAVLAVVLAASLAACKPLMEPPPDVLDCQPAGPPPAPGYADKTAIDASAEWFYRRTFFDSGTALDGFATLQRARFEIGETELAVTDSTSGAALASWPVADHFDIQSCRDAAGVEHQWEVHDRPWNERRFLRLDLSQRTAASANIAAEIPGWTATLTLLGTSEPNVHFETDYAEATEDASVELDAPTCAETSTTSAFPSDCSAHGKVRHSFRTVTAARGSYVARSAPAYERFGYLQQDGSLQRVADGPVVYYLAHDVPSAWRRAAVEVAAEYDRVWRPIITNADPATPAFEIRANDCSRARITAVLSDHPELEPALAAAVCGSAGCSDPLASLSGGNITRACDALESASDGVFRWQRPGDLRFNLIAAAHPRGSLFWGAWASRAVDPDSGQILQATVWIDASRLGRIADRVARIAGVDGTEDRAILSAAKDRAQQLAQLQADASFVDALSMRVWNLSAAGYEGEDAQRARLSRIGGTALEAELRDPWVGALFAGPSWPSDAPLPPGAAAKSTPLARLDILLGAARRAELAKLSPLGFCFLTRDASPHYEGLALAVEGTDPAAAQSWVEEKLAAHAMLHVLGHNLGLAHNFEGSSDALDYGEDFWRALSAGEDAAPFAYASVMDALDGEAQAYATRLGRYDEAALRFAYKNQVQVFTAAASLPDPRDYDYHRLPELLCPNGGCTSEEAIAAISMRDWVDAPTFDTAPGEVRSSWCDDHRAYLQPSLFCRPGDRGASVREIFASYYLNWAGYYPFTNRVSEGFEPERTMEPAVEAFAYASDIAQTLHHEASGRINFFHTELAADLTAASALALNLASEIVGQPEDIRMCPWPGSQPEIFIPWYYLNACSNVADLDTPEAVQESVIQLPRGPARPFLFRREFMDGPWNEVGSYFDHQNVLWLVGLVRPTVFDSVFGPERRASLFHLYAPELRGLYDSLLGHRAFFVTTAQAEATGSYWCRDPGAPDYAYLGHFEPRRLIDVQTGQANPGPSAGCTNPSLVHHELPDDVLAQSMFWAFGLFTSPDDAALDLGGRLAIYRVGMDDQGVDWSQVPADQLCTVTNVDSGAEYRAIRGADSLPCALIVAATDAQNDMLGSGAPTYREISRQWFEWLDLARELRALFIP